ncbi:hypothetical protein HZA87_04450 [Candidatus Uhrbacteria bacterium]|nr:hypothetical protein [Candidatus Uhrbacteria bacterium]
MPIVPPPGEGANPAATPPEKTKILRRPRFGVPAETRPVSVPAAATPVFDSEIAQTRGETAPAPAEPEPKKKTSRAKKLAPAAAAEAPQQEAGQPLTEAQPPASASEAAPASPESAQSDPFAVPESGPAPKPLVPVKRNKFGRTVPASSTPAQEATPDAAAVAAASASAEAAPATPSAAEEEEEEEETPEVKKSLFSHLSDSFRHSVDRFKARFRGEVTPQDEKDYKPTGTDVSKNIAAGLMSVVASYTGIKIVADLPEWLTQKYFTAQERKRIKEALKSTEAEPDNVREDVISLETRRTKLAEAIRASKFLTVEKQKTLIQQVEDALNATNKENLLARTERDEEIARLLDEAIQSRIKNTQVLKETLNSALMLTGLSAMRGVAYGSVALYERYARLSEEKKARGLAPGVGFNRLIVDGMKETWAQLKGGGAETKTGKALNFVQGATTVLRAAGFAELAISEMMQEGGPSSMIEASLKAWEEKGTGQAAWNNIKAPWERIGSLFGRASEAVTEAPADSGADTGDTGTSDAGDTGAGTSDAGHPGTGSTDHEPGVAPEPGSSAEYTESQIETGTVHKGDGIIKILERQGLSAKQALTAAREAGIIHTGGDTRLSTEAIGRIAVLAHGSPDGHVTIGFFDAQTGHELTLEEARAQGFTYEHGIGAPTGTTGAPTGTTEGETTPETPEAEGITEVPHTLAGGKLSLNTIEGGFNFDVDPSGLTSAQLGGMVDRNALEMASTQEIAGQQEAVKELSQRMALTQTILERLDARHLGDSAEAHLLGQRLGEDLAEAQRMDAFNKDDLQKIQVEVNRFHADVLQAVPDPDRINDIRIPGLGKIEFSYDEDGKPEIVLNQLITNAKHVLQMRAANMLVDGWEDTVAGQYVSQQEMAVAGPVYLMNEALKELKAAGHSESAEAKFLVAQLGGYLKENAGVLDGNNAIVKDAAERAGVYTEIFTHP